MKRCRAPPRRSAPPEPPRGLRGRVIIDAEMPGDGRRADTLDGHELFRATGVTTYPERYDQNPTPVTITEIEKIGT